MTILVILLALVPGSGKEVVLSTFPDSSECRMALPHYSKDMPQLEKFECFYYHKGERTPDYGYGVLEGGP